MGRAFYSGRTRSRGRQSLKLDSTTLTITTDPSTLANAQAALLQIDAAIGLVNTAVGVVGANQARIESAAENIKTIIQNFSAAESTIRDLDMAEEMTTFTKNQILPGGTACSRMRTRWAVHLQFSRVKDTLSLAPRRRCCGAFVCGHTKIIIRSSKTARRPRGFRKG